MQFGVAGDLETGRVAREVGFDYLEMRVGDLLRPLEGEVAFRESLARASGVGLPVPVVNVFLPPDLKIVGHDIRSDALHAYVSTTMRRAEQACVEIVVLGSGDARYVPSDYDTGAAFHDLAAFCQWVGPIAAQHGVMLAIEPLSRSETNLINTVAEGAALVRQVDHPSVRLLVDGYHWATDKDSREEMLEHAGLIVHAQVATVGDRTPPCAADECTEFLSALRESGYSGRVSIEGFTEDPRAELAPALDIMRRQLA